MVLNDWIMRSGTDFTSLCFFDFEYLFHFKLISLTCHLQCDNFLQFLFHRASQLNSIVESGISHAKDGLDLQALLGFDLISSRVEGYGKYFAHSTTSATFHFLFAKTARSMDPIIAYNRFHVWVALFLFKSPPLS